MQVTCKTSYNTHQFGINAPLRNIKLMGCLWLTKLPVRVNSDREHKIGIFTPIAVYIVTHTVSYRLGCVLEKFLKNELENVENMLII